MINENDFQKAVDLINKSNNVLITTHTRPDGDACGSIVAMTHTLTTLGKNTTQLFLSEIPQWYQFLFSHKPAVLGRDLTIEQLKQGDFCEPDLIIILDTNSRSQLPQFDEYLKQSSKPVLIIDHHITNDNLGNVELVDTTAAAVGLIVFDLFKYARWPITEKIAQSLFVAIATDTGWFRFRNADARTYRATAELIEIGAQPAQLYHDLYQNFSLARFKLTAAMLNNLELHLDGRYAAQYLQLSDFEHADATYSDTEDLINECQKISTVAAAALFVELQDGRVKLSLRSNGSIDVCKIAQKFGGGGHAMAAGAHLPGPLSQAKQSILSLIQEQFAEADSRI